MDTEDIYFVKEHELCHDTNTRCVVESKVVRMQLVHITLVVIPYNKFERITIIYLH